MLRLPTSALCASVMLFVLTAGTVARAQESPVILGLGDSIGEAVQSGDANVRTQPFSYLNLLAQQLGADFPLPLIASNILGQVGDTSGRSRVDPTVETFNLAVSGHDVDDLLNKAADALSEAEINDETDLVLFPRLGSPIEIAESLGAQLFVCWIGNNDVLTAALSFDQLDGSQLTPIADFQADFSEIAQRLGALGGSVVFANIPDVTNIGFLLDREDLIKFEGSDFGLPEGDLTSIMVLLVIRLGLNDGSIIQNPNFVLDAGEIAVIQQRLDAFNQIIANEAAAIGAPVVDINTIFDNFAANPPVIAGVEISPRFLGGFLSLDAVHPSNFGHAVVANAFIQQINANLGFTIPPISGQQLGQIFLTDPFIDKDGDLVVTGRFLAGFLETVGPFIGISGDANDFDPTVQGAQAPATDRLRAEVTKEDVIAAFKRLYGGITGSR